MPCGLDHIVHAVRDLDAAAALYRELGFTVGARNKHPWGTHNHIVQLPGFFIELLTLAEPEKLVSDGFSIIFAAYNRDFIERGDGLSMLILESQDAAADAAAFGAAGIAASSEAMRFEREGKRPDGSAVKVGFSLAFADDMLAPDIHFATCRWRGADRGRRGGGRGAGAASRFPAGLYRRPKCARYRRRFHDRFATWRRRADNAGGLRAPLWAAGAGCLCWRATGGPALFRPCISRRAAVCHGRRAGI